jgi:hypothetical protein
VVDVEVVVEVGVVMEHKEVEVVEALVEVVMEVEVDVQLKLHNNTCIITK